MLGKEPVISNNDLITRSCFTHEHFILTEEQWSQAHFNDELKFIGIGFYGGMYVLRRSDVSISCTFMKKTVKYWGEGNVIAWGVITAAVGPGPLIHLEGTVIAEIYKNILRQHSRPHFPILLSFNYYLFFMTTLIFTLQCLSKIFWVMKGFISWFCHLAVPISPYRKRLEDYWRWRTKEKSKEAKWTAGDNIEKRMELYYSIILQEINSVL